MRRSSRGPCSSMSVMMAFTWGLFVASSVVFGPLFFSGRSGEAPSWLEKLYGFMTSTLYAFGYPRD